MRQADSTIKGYLYQFNKSILEILRMSDDAFLVLEGVIEDIDILSPTGTTTIQCKYHEDKEYKISSVAVPIIEMLCNYCEASYVGREMNYVLYAYFADNADSISISDFIRFLNTTQNKEIQIKYFHRIYNIPDASILEISNKTKKSDADKKKLLSYYEGNRTNLSLRINIDKFWSHFRYIKAEQFDQLKERIIEELNKYTDIETALTLYYPNAFSYVASLSAQKNEADRTVSKLEFIEFLSQQRTILLNKWTLEALDRKAVLKTKHISLTAYFASNPDIRAFVFSDVFLRNNADSMIPFIREYIGKYYKKRALQKPPIFVFGDNSTDIMQSIIMELYKYQQPVHTGIVGMQFLEDSFISDNNCPANYVCKVSKLSNISTRILEQCRVNQLYTVGTIDISLHSKNYITESLAVQTINELRYLVNLTRSLEV